MALSVRRILLLVTVAAMMAAMMALPAQAQETSDVNCLQEGASSTPFCIGDDETTIYECDPQPSEIEFGTFPPPEGTCTQISGSSTGQQFSCSLVFWSHAFGVYTARYECELPTPPANTNSIVQANPNASGGLDNQSEISQGNAYGRFE